MPKTPHSSRSLSSSKGWVVSTMIRGVGAATGAHIGALEGNVAPLFGLYFPPPLCTADFAALTRRHGPAAPHHRLLRPALRRRRAPHPPRRRCPPPPPAAGPAH